MHCGILTNSATNPLLLCDNNQPVHPTLEIWSRLPVADLRRYSLAAIVLLVVLRVGIGWQLLYEGFWKIDTFSSQSPWTSDGYLKGFSAVFSVR